MNSQTNTLTEGPLAKQIFLVSLPLALSNLLQVLFNMSDVAWWGGLPAPRRWALWAPPARWSPCSPAFSSA